MDSYLQAIVPVITFIGLGYLAKLMRLIDVDITKKLIKFLFTIPLPILVLFNFAMRPVEAKYFALPLIAILLSSVLMTLSYGIGRAIGLSKQRTGTLLVATGISSTLLYVLPLVNAFYGVENTKYLFLYDFGNGLLAWTVVYYLAGQFGNKQKQSFKSSFKAVVGNPMIWALIGGIVIGTLRLQFPYLVSSVVSQLGGLTNPLLLMCVGVFLDFSFFKSPKHVLHLVVGAVLVMGVSYLISLYLTGLFQIEGVVQKIITLCAIAPAGSLTVAFSVEHDLDVDFASALVAMTMVFGVALIPILALI